MTESRDMLRVLFTRIPAGERDDLRGKPMVALRHAAGEALVRRFLREQGRGDNHEIRKGEKGKPYIKGVRGLYFNVSHSGERVVAAFSGKEVGIDIERHGRVRLEIATRFFHAGEVAALLSLAGEERERALADYWAIKESFLKYLGTGLTRPLSTFRVETGETGIVLHDDNTRLPLHVHRCPVDAGYSCFTCGETGSPPLATTVEWDDLYNKEFR
ncbi:MAG: 4'-phosphopantetheinyl transferase superfamily protein [Odoribacteraceae bacterium]|jgi:4'-phosphopantetheinyl transferase|nr:4'-phosphopantetheinyl transferase superfamily protein [Odoribacteraceae bacterium]